MNPNTGEDVDHWSCAVTWMPMLTIENSQQQRHTGAAVESFRNEVVKSNEENRQLYIDVIQQNGILPVNVTSFTNLNTLPGESGE
jgi:capsule polysaccharide export protein KpsE/RkpR